MGGSDLVGMDDTTSPTTTPNDLALVDFVGGECSLQTDPEAEPLAITVGGKDGSGGEPFSSESLTLLNGDLAGPNVGGVEGSEASEPVRVELLAIVIPHGAEVSGFEVGRGVGRKPLDWVMRKEKGVGKVLGASYEGYEQAVIELLMDIEARHIERKAAIVGIQKTTSSGKKCSKELKRLLSSVNYEAQHSKEAKGKGKLPGGDNVVD